MDILLSCRAPWPSKIFDEPKEGEVRKDLELRNCCIQWAGINIRDRALIYETAPTKAIVGVAQIEHVVFWENASQIWSWWGKRTGFESFDDLRKFVKPRISSYLVFGERERLYVSLDDMKRLFDVRAPHSFRYLESWMANQMIDMGRGEYKLHSALGMKEWA